MMIGAVACAFAAAVPAGRTFTPRSGYFNLPFVVFLFYAFWILLGTTYYHVIGGHTVSSSFFSSLQLGLSVGFCAPAEHSAESKLFPTFFILLGSAVVAGMLGRMATELNFTEIDESSASPLITLEEFRAAKRPEFIDYVKYACYWFQFRVNSIAQRPRVFLTVALASWVVLGVVYGMWYEELEYLPSLSFAVSALSTAGLITPSCDAATAGSAECRLSDARAAFLGLYLMIGVPLYTMTLGQIADFVIERASKASKAKDADGLELPAALRSGPNSMNPGEFIIRELLRRGQTDIAQINAIQQRFHELNVKSGGKLNFDEFAKGGYVAGGKADPRFTAVQEKPFAKASESAKKAEPPVDRDGGDDCTADYPRRYPKQRATHAR